MGLLSAIPYCVRGSSASQSVVWQSHAVPEIWQSASQFKVLPLVLSPQHGQLFYAGWLLWSGLEEEVKLAGFKVFMHSLILIFLLILIFSL